MKSLIAWFASNGVVANLLMLLIALQSLVLRWGLAPLQEVARSLKKIQQGEAEKLVEEVNQDDG